MQNSASAPRPKAAGLLSPLRTTGLALASASAASAGIVYHAAPPITTSSSFSIDASGDDFNFNYSPASSFSAKVSLTPVSGHALITTSSVAFGDTIDGSDSFTSSQVSTTATGSTYYGFSLLGGQTLYGWMKVSLDASSGSVEQWAYEDSGAPIQVGAVPEPASAAALAALLAGSAAAMKRRRREDAVAA